MRNATFLLAVAMWLALLAPAAGAQNVESGSMADAARLNARLGMEYMKQGELATAREKIEKALLQNPKDVGVQVSAGLLYEQMRDPDLAEKHYRQALRVDRENPEAQNALGAFLCRNGRAKDGEEIFLQAARNPLYRTPEVAYTNAGVCARRNGRLDRAEDYLRLAIGSGGQYAEALLQLAGVSFERGNSLQARAFLQRYLSAAPPSPEALLLGHMLESQLGDLDAADDYAKRLRSRFPDAPEARILGELSQQGPP